MFFALLAASLPEKVTPAAAEIPVVVELFTSQSCSSCPPAEANFRDLAARSDLIALEWHVDYWDELRHGADGRWKDPFSSSDNTKRQQTYNLAIRDTSAVFTPQAIINGAYEVIGSRTSDLNRLIDRAKTDRKNPVMAVNNGSGPMFHLQAALGEAEVLAVTFKRSDTTRVKGGENNGKKLAEAHIVTDAQIVSTKSGWLELPSPEEGYGCAILIHDPQDRSIIGAAYCQ